MSNQPKYEPANQDPNPRDVEGRPEEKLKHEREQRGPRKSTITEEAPAVQRPPEDS